MYYLVMRKHGDEKNNQIYFKISIIEDNLKSLQISLMVSYSQNVSLVFQSLKLPLTFIAFLLYCIDIKFHILFPCVTYSQSVIYSGI